MQKKAIISIIIPTFNSEKTLDLTLDSIRKQDYPQEAIEILIIDGGSSDRTLEIAEEYGCTILKNPKVQQEYAKHTGLLNAAGKFVMFLDSDEVLENQHAIFNRVRILSENPKVKILLTGGYKRPENYSLINDYINNYSDPFSHFMYGISNDSRYFIGDLSRKYKKTGEFEDRGVFESGKSNDLPLVDIAAGQTLNLEYLKKLLGKKIKDAAFIPKVFYLITEKTHNLTVLKNDSVIHYSVDSLRKFLKKIRWKIIVNVHYPSLPGTGFSNRREFQTACFRLKKYLFIIYAVTLILPLADSIYFALKKKMPVLLLHCPLSVYAAVTICYQYFLKLIGIKPKLYSYGGETKELQVSD